MFDISQIKSRITCVEYAQRNNLPIRYSGDRCTSPLRAGAKNKTSFWVFDDHFTDFGSGQSGDVIDLAAYLNHNGDKGKAITELANIVGADNLHNSTEWVNYTQNLCNKIENYHKNLTDTDREYLHNRGINDTTINAIKIGRTNEGRLSFPYWKNGYICYYATRSMPNCKYPDRKYMKMPIDDFNDHTIWGLHTIDRDLDRKLLVIAEGAFDALSFDQENYSVISAITGFFSKDQLPTALSIAKSFTKVFLVYDNDNETHAGEKFTLKMAKILLENRIPCLIGTVPFAHRYKDVSDYYADGNDLTELIDNAIDGTQFLADKITDTQEFETFARDVCRYMTAPQVDVFFSTIDTKFPDNFLKTLCKECKKSPPDDVIANEIISKHQLIYNPKVNFFEYNGKYWQERSDTEIEQYISNALGIYVTGPRISSILRVIKSQTVTNRLLNTSSVVNFVNGTLELTELPPYYHFREHRDTDFCTYCLDYPYLPNAKSQEWENFIDTVTESIGKRIAFLQEFAGYVLYPDNRIHKVAVLVGSGSNGKSVYLKTMEKIFGASNVKHIDAAELGDPFRAIHLQGAMLNISEEVKDDLTSAEAMIKKIASGDELNACYKGKQFVDFVPRAKLLLSFNNYPKFSDKSDGISRRLSFIEFPLKFVEIPVAENERLIDRTLESKFAQNSQLSGIFNWVLQGYVSVRACGYITETDEHITVLNDFKEESDHTITFAKEYEITSRISNTDLYKDYQYWCIDNGVRAENRMKFAKLISKHFNAFRQDIKPFRTSSVRGYEKMTLPRNL